MRRLDRLGRTARSRWAEAAYGFVLVTILLITMIA